MNRRLFLQRAATAGTLSFAFGGFTVKAYGRTPLLDALLSTADVDRVLVLVQLIGGNDGLNMVIPLDQYPQLTAARSNIAIDETKVLPLSPATGLHPAMTGLQALYGDGRLSVVQGVSYPNPNFSHFRATDIWLTGADYNQVLESGWLGRYLDQEFPGYPGGYPSTAMPDPLGIQIGSVVSPALDGPTASMGLAITNPNASYILPGGADTAPNTPAGHELTFVRQVAEQAQAYSATVKAAAAKATNLSTKYPAKGTNSLADQLRIVAQLIAGGLRTRVYVVNLGGFDTHSAQVDSTDSSLGTHAKLLGQVSDAITAFMDDITLLGIAGKVVGLTFSEFGRRIKSNASLGTDHGTCVPMFIFGTGVAGGLVGTNPVLPAAATVNDNLQMQYDFRAVYATVLQDWLGASLSELQNVLLNSYTKLPLIASGSVLSTGGPSTPQEFSLSQNYPNPFNPSTVIRYVLPRTSNVRLEVFAISGQRIATLVDGTRGAGEHDVTFSANGLASGVYIYRLEAGSFVESRKMTLVR
jgi:uncharacterized protein (DUF1501 family)